MHGFPAPRYTATMCDVAVFRQARAPVEKSKDFSDQEIEAQLALMLSIAQRLGHSRKSSDKVLDFGCGIGRTVSALMLRGYDAYGVDVGEWWGRDNDAYWHDSPLPPAHIRDRLSAVSESDYRLPYPDRYFDLIISSQVFEHVFNYVDVFRELGRVVKPGGLSVHVFPGPGSPMEPHLGIPINLLSKHDWWLKLWALKRSHRPTWGGEYRFLRDSMRSNNYPSRTQLHACANEAGVSLSFHEDVYLEAANRRPMRIIRAAARAGLAWLVAPIVRRMCQRTMVIRPRSSALGI